MDILPSGWTIWEKFFYRRLEKVLQRVNLYCGFTEKLLDTSCAIFFILNFAFFYGAILFFYLLFKNVLSG